eukprot:NODE_4503_length_793_cov_6.747312_g3738_i0.p3 GENE.NODE_4503_length_793_cov_6.747312_g3738_i0~~NODE_4503_length_793_cov_6.747312_g3738_i0.p3  ORF type:complete len:63 (+),score=0.83 NODE_4503_length_793_cov_6.747312_g3738_i0:232-420(+)
MAKNARHFWSIFGSFLPVGPPSEQQQRSCCSDGSAFANGKGGPTVKNEPKMGKMGWSFLAHF